MLAQRGAHITIVARNQKKLDDALKQVEVCHHPDHTVYTTELARN